MSELLERLKDKFQDEDARYDYADGILNACVAAQIKILRESQEMSQEQLAVKLHTKQSGISRFENANYSSWKVETLRNLARAFGVRLHISFEEFGTLIPEIENFKKEKLSRRQFSKDPAFQNAEATVQPKCKIETTIVLSGGASSGAGSGSRKSTARNKLAARQRLIRKPQGADIPNKVVHSGIVPPKPPQMSKILTTDRILRNA